MGMVQSHAWFGVLLYHIIPGMGREIQKITGGILPICALIIVMVYKIYSYKKTYIL